MSDAIIEEALRSQEQEESQEISRHNPDLLNLMTALIGDTTEKEPEAKVTEVVYLTVKSVLRSPQIRPTVGSVIPAIFAYYIEAYDLHARISRSDEIGQPFKNEAVLGLFDLYVEDHNDHTLRRLVDMGAKAIHEVIVGKLAQIEDLKMDEVMAPLSTIALLTETVNDYIGSSRRKKNVAYIAWLRTLLEKVLDSHDLAIVETDEELKLILPQIINRAPVIQADFL